MTKSRSSHDRDHKSRSRPFSSIKEFTFFIGLYPYPFVAIFQYHREI